MGITIVQKSNLAQKKHHPKIALVLAGGAITGGTFKVGGLKALNDFLVNRKVTDFDIYVGVSAGALLAVPLAGGIGPEEILKSLDGSSRIFSQLSPFHVYRPNIEEFVQRPFQYLYRSATYLPGIFCDSFLALPKLWKPLKEGFLKFCSERNYTSLEEFLGPLLKVVYRGRTLPSLSEAIPTGLMDNCGLEQFLRHNMKKNGMPNDFRLLKKLRGKSLYAIAMDLDSAERIVFGPDEKNDVSISEAVQASSALPFFYKPARIKGVDYIDGGVRRTTNMDLAIQKGADLVICYNPFRPFSNKLVLEYLEEQDRYISKGRRLSDSGIFMIFNQVFRTIYHTRIHYFIEQMKADQNFKGDIILIEPQENDAVFFEMNPFSFWSRAKAAKHGFLSVRSVIEKRYKEISKILASYGIQTTKDLLDLDYEEIVSSRSDDLSVMKVLESKRPRLRIVGRR